MCCSAPRGDKLLALEPDFGAGVRRRLLTAPITPQLVGSVAVADGRVRFRIPRLGRSSQQQSSNLEGDLAWINKSTSTHRRRPKTPGKRPRSSGSSRRNWSTKAMTRTGRVCISPGAIFPMRARGRSRRSTFAGYRSICPLGWFARACRSSPRRSTRRYGETRCVACPSITTSPANRKTSLTSLLPWFRYAMTRVSIPW